MVRIPILPLATLLMVVALSASIPGFATAQSAAHSRAPAKPKPHSVVLTTVLPLSEGKHMWTAAATEFWTPSAADLRPLEAGLPKSVATYYRQYIGIVKGGKRLIFINGFSASVASEFTGGKNDWHTHAAQVLDGGRSFFHATYDPKTQKFDGPVFNGMG